MSFGTPTGRARMAGATSEAPPEPPAEMMPATLPWRRSQLAKASAIAVTDAPRSAPNTPDPPRPWFSAISCARDVAGGELAAGGDVDQARPQAAARRSGRE